MCKISPVNGLNWQTFMKHPCCIKFASVLFFLTEYLAHEEGQYYSIYVTLSTKYAGFLVPLSCCYSSSHMKWLQSYKCANYDWVSLGKSDVSRATRELSDSVRRVFICTELCIAVVLFKLICSLLTHSLVSNFVQTKKQQLICKHCQNIFQLVCNFLTAFLCYCFLVVVVLCFRFCWTCRSVNKISVFKALGFRKKKVRTQCVHDNVLCV